MLRQSKWSEKAGAAQRGRVRARRAGYRTHSATLAALLGVGALGCGPAAVEDDTPPTPKVLLIGIDGVRPDVLAQVSTPSIDALVAKGAMTTKTTTTTPSVSGPSWSSMLTGVWPEKHGVVSNDFTAPRYEDYPDFLSRIESVRPDLTTVAVADWPPLMTLQGRRPLVGLDVDVREAPDGYDLGWAEADDYSVEFVVEQLRTADPDALFVYLGNPDETSHEHRSIGDEYRQAIVRADTQVGRLVDAMEGRSTYASEDWLVLVSTDHGRRADGGHGGDSPEEMTTFIVVSGPSAPSTIGGPTYIVDVAATALAHLGIAGAGSLDGRPLTATGR